MPCSHVSTEPKLSNSETVNERCNWIWMNRLRRSLCKSREHGMDSDLMRLSQPHSFWTLRKELDVFLKEQE